MRKGELPSSEQMDRFFDRVCANQWAEFFDWKANSRGQPISVYRHLSVGDELRAQPRIRMSEEPPRITGSELEAYLEKELTPNLNAYRKAFEYLQRAAGEKTLKLADVEGFMQQMSGVIERAFTWLWIRAGNSELFIARIQAAAQPWDFFVPRETRNQIRPQAGSAATRFAEIESRWLLAALRLKGMIALNLSKQKHHP